MEEEVSYGKQRKLVTVFLEINPRGAVRVTSKGKHSPRAKGYHKYMNAVRWLYRASLVNQGLSSDVLPEGEIVEMDFGIEIESGSKLMLSRVGQYHKKKPDWDNLCKAFLDSLFYKRGMDDSHIYHVGKVTKRWVAQGEGYISCTFFISCS